MKNRTGVIRHRFKKLHVYEQRASARLPTGRLPRDPEWQHMERSAVFEAVRRQHACIAGDYTVLERRLASMLRLGQLMQNIGREVRLMVEDGTIVAVKEVK